MEGEGAWLASYRTVFHRTVFVYYFFVNISWERGTPYFRHTLPAVTFFKKVNGLAQCRTCLCWSSIAVPRNQISWDLTYDPRRRYEAHRRRDIKKTSSQILFEIFRRSQKDLLKIYNKIGRRFYKKIFGRSSVHFLPFDKIF